MSQQDNKPQLQRTCCVWLQDALKGFSIVVTSQSELLVDLVCVKLHRGVAPVGSFPADLTVEWIECRILQDAHLTWKPAILNIHEFILKVKSLQTSFTLSLEQLTDLWGFAALVTELHLSLMDAAWCHVTWATAGLCWTNQQPSDTGNPFKQRCTK